MSQRLIVHGLVLALANLVGLYLGMIALGAFGRGDQLTTQLPVAIVASVLGFGLWVWIVNRATSARLRYRGREDGGWTYVIALPLAAIIFVPLHFVTQGYLTSLSNILALWMFQLGTNAIAVGVAALVTPPGGRPVTPTRRKGKRKAQA